MKKRSVTSSSDGRHISLCRLSHSSKAVVEDSEHAAQMPAAWSVLSSSRVTVAMRGERCACVSLPIRRFQALSGGVTRHFGPELS